MKIQENTPLEDEEFHSVGDILRRLPKRTAFTATERLMFRIRTVWNAWYLSPTVFFFPLVIKWLVEQGFFSRNWKNRKPE